MVPITKLYLPALSSDRAYKTNTSRIHFNKGNLQKLRISHHDNKLSLPMPTGFALNSLSIDYSIRAQVEDNRPSSNSPEGPVIQSSMWNWRGYSIRYQCSGDRGPALLLVHGFGANSDHWRKNIPVLAKSNRVYAVDLIGYGNSDKPNPRSFGDKSFYTFETWANQLNEFCADVIKDEAFFICNSIGGLVGLQAAVMESRICKGIILLNISLRMLHIKKQPWFGRPFVRSFQSLLRNTPVGKYFFKMVATSDSVRSILCQCYHDTSQVTEELVQKILLPGLQPGAVDVFLEFICYSEGPLPEELLPQVKCPVLIAWGDKDPWEPIDLGRAYGNFDNVEDFIVLPNVGHCPQDEAPHLVNPLIESFVMRHATLSPTI
ncbi:Abhydrolase_6 domain-containing protein [Cephalotus follicularis]|uniref:Abhydrolase_6 domain-containing protein n=1 Tax=Cephalotus follicularis TaxID=3775 RepID=A0A1Q3BV45_CEPFO|nr:Abhydrolase_6 domain-containing protein [Cephalotus follicularis]